MAIILNIDTSSSICSVSLAKDGEIIQGYESSKKMDHSTSLAPFVKNCLDYLRQKGEKLEAVSVTIGPGSYTGLRIGLSLAKGISFGLEIPLITLSSLKVLTVRAIFSYPDFNGNELIVPMMDARRMEVYTGVYNSALEVMEPETAFILDESSFKNLIQTDKVLFIGDGSDKFKELYKGSNGVWLGPLLPHAKYMATLSELYFKKKQFSDVAYSVPSYLKEYQTTQSKSRL